MRAIGQIHDENYARRFGEFLYAQGVENEIDANEEGAWTVWILDDEKLDAARDHLAAYVEDPDNERYQSGARQGRAAHQRDEAEAAAEKPVVIDARARIRRRETMGGAGFVTIGMVLSAIVVFILQFLHNEGSGGAPDIEAILMISTSRTELLPEVLSGQVWRLWTPALLHFGLIHILFNTLMTKDLGGLLESAHGSLFLGSLVFNLALISNLAQYMATGPGFGGLSGVVYGMFGYAWMRGHTDRGTTYQLTTSTIVILVAWFVLCWTPLLPNIANWAHAAGLLVGAASGWFGGMLANARRKA